MEPRCSLHYDRPSIYTGADFHAVKFVTPPYLSSETGLPIRDTLRNRRGADSLSVGTELLPHNEGVAIFSTAHKKRACMGL
jgi:hypothetical protein